MARNRIDILNVKDRSLSLIVADFHECQNCRIVDLEKNRVEVGYPCPNCTFPSPSGQMFFNLSVHSLINLMQEFFHKDKEYSESHNSFNFDKSKNAELAVVIFFATLREVLLNDLLYDLMIAQKLSGNICKRLFADSYTHRQRIEKLFPTLSGMKWKKAIETINQEREFDFINLDKFIREVVKARNEFLHEGKKSAITDELTKKCMKNVYPLLNLYVSLHNHFVVPYYQQQ